MSNFRNIRNKKGKQMILENEKIELIKELLDALDGRRAIEQLCDLQDRCLSIINNYPSTSSYRAVIEHIFTLSGGYIENIISNEEGVSNA